MKRASLTFALLLGACSVPQPIAGTDVQIATFHKLLDTEDYAAIWKDTSLEMRGAATEEQMDKIFAAVHRKLGKVIESKQIGWRTNMTTNGTFAEVQMDTRFEKGTGQENFVYRQDGTQLKLAGYHITSNDMMTN